MSNVYPSSDPVTIREDFREFIRNPPTFEQALAFIRCKYGESTSEELVREWYEATEASCWCDAKGNAIMNWPRAFYFWKKHCSFYNALYDPERLPDARKGQGGGRRKADNWRGTRKEDIGDVLG